MQEILVLRPDHIGDVLLTTPVLSSLRSSFPKAKITMLIGSWSAELLHRNPDVDDIVTCDLPWLARTKSSQWGEIMPVARELRKRRFDAIVNLRVAAKTALFAYLCGGKSRWGFDVPKSKWAWTHTVAYRKDNHIVDRYLDIAKALGCSVDNPTLKLFPNEEDEAYAESLLRSHRPSVVISPGAGHKAKLWETNRWAEVADYIADKGFDVFFSGSATELPLVETIRSQMRSESINLAGRVGILQLASVMGRNIAVLTVDSAPMHIAVAMRTPVIALFGPTDSRQWGPYPNGAPNIVVQEPIDCREHGKWKRRSKKSMKMISVSQVFTAFDKLLEAISS